MKEIRKMFNNPEKGNYTINEVADLLQVSVLTVRKYLKEGSLKGFKLGNNWRIPKDAYEDFVKTKMKG